MKRISLIILSVILCSSMLFANGTQESVEKPEGKVFNIYCWNTEFQTRFNDYFEAKGLVPDGVTVNWIITPNADNAYQNKLDEALLAQDNANDDDKIDIFLVEADYALKYVDTPYCLDVINDVGLTQADVSGMYKYTKDIMTDSNGNLKGLSWQSCPGGFIYRRSIAKDVLGTDDPQEVQKRLSDWTKFDAVAKEAKAKGYFMLSGYDDAFRIFSDNTEKPWVDANGKITISDSIENWITQTKTYTDMGYNNKANLWSAESWAGAAKDGKVFGYFGPGWFVDFSLAPAVLEDPEGPKTVGNGSYGDWGLCTGPQGFSWGGTWICVAAGSDNIELAKDLLYTMTCDKDTLVAIAKDMGDFTNNVAAMEELANSDYKNDFLGGQNHISMFLDSATSIDRSTMGPYDQGMTESIQDAFADYFNGTVTKQQAYDNFYTSVIEKYPNLSR
ncbi:MAG: extracellular solute-binding protein [Pleomorphochaeta sp.]